MNDTKKYIQEALEVARAYRKLEPYMKFGNFVESLKRNENTALIESIQSGVMVIIEEQLDVLSSVVKSSREMFNKPEKILTAAEKASKGDYSEILKVVYPILVGYARKKNPDNADEQDNYLSKLVERMIDSDKLKLINPEYFRNALERGGNVKDEFQKLIYNFVKNFIKRDTDRDIKQGYDKNPLADNEWGPGDENRGRYVEFKDKSKATKGKEYGKIVGYRRDQGEIKAEIRWKGIDGRKSLPIEAVPKEDLNAYDMVDTEKFGKRFGDQGASDSSSDDEGTETSIFDKYEADSDFDTERLSNISKEVENVINNLNIEDKGKQFLKLYIEQKENADPETVNLGTKKLEYIQKKVKEGKISEEDAKDKIEELTYLIEQSRPFNIGKALEKVGGSRRDAQKWQQEFFNAIEDSKEIEDLTDVQ